MKIRAAVIASVLFASAFYLPSDFHGSRMMAFYGLALLWLLGGVWEQLHLSVGIALSWAIFSGVRVFAWPDPIYGPAAANLFDSLSAQAAFAVLIVASIQPVGYGRVSRHLAEAFGYLCIIDSILVIAQWIYGAEPGGLFGNPSMNACVIACTYPIWTRNHHKVENSIEAIGDLLGWLLPIFAILVSRSNMAVAALMTASVAPVIFFRRGNKILLLFCWGVTLPILAWAFMGAKLGQDSGRFAVWGAALRWWWENVNVWIGSGLGTWFALGPHIQSTMLGRTDAHDGFLMVLHSDTIQILFEQGIIGLALFVTMMVCAFKSAIAKKRMWVVAAMAAYCVTACGNFPMHLPVPGFLGAFLLISALI